MKVVAKNVVDISVEFQIEDFQGGIRFKEELYGNNKALEINCRLVY